MLPPRVVLGTAYYPEYLPRELRERVKTDLDLMAAAGITAIRVGESVWSTWEPRDGVFDLDWIPPVLDGAADRGIDVVLGTPTYAVPPWLQRPHPEIAAERRTGERVPLGCPPGGRLSPAGVPVPRRAGDPADRRALRATTRP